MMVSLYKKFTVVIYHIYSFIFSFILGTVGNSVTELKVNRTFVVTQILILDFLQIVTCRGLVMFADIRS